MLILAMKKPFNRVSYNKLNPRQKENYNFAKLSAAMADCGYALMRLSDDWKGADAIAVHIDGSSHLFVQLKATGLILDRRYERKNIWMACKSKSGDWYVFPHDKVLSFAAKTKDFRKGDYWQRKGRRYWSDIPKYVRDYLEKEGYGLSQYRPY